tara:strand:- start:2367 stop:2906 length:540 start_codon:yes stop_codon:yes gene_type:complete
MAWTYNDSVIREGRSWTDDDGIKHPTNWGSWSDEEKIAAGLVWVDDPAPYDPRFYWDADTPKSLDDVPVLNEDEDAAPGTPALDEDGNPVITPGLKSQWIGQIKTEAGSLLAPTDWYVIRRAEASVAIPADVLTYREAVRTASNSMEAQINAVTTHAAFVTLIAGTPDNPSTFNDWPKE